jgi:hypothetical protein
LKKNAMMMANCNNDILITHMTILLDYFKIENIIIIPKLQNKLVLEINLSF